MSDALCGVEPLLRPPGEVLSSQRRYVIQSILVHTHITHPYRPEQADNRDLPVAAASAPADVSHHRRWVVVELSEPAEGLLHIGYRVDGLVNLIAICGTGEVDHLRDVIVRPYIVLINTFLLWKKGVTAAALASLLSVAGIGMNPPIWLWSISMIAAPFAFFSTTFAEMAGYFFKTISTASIVSVNPIFSRS